MASQTLSPAVYCGSPSIQGSSADITQYTKDPFMVGSTSYYRTVLKFRTPNVDITGTGSLKVSVTCTDEQYLHRFMASISATLVSTIGDISNSNSQGLNSKVTANAIKVIDALGTTTGTSFTLDFGSGFAPNTDYYVYLVRNTTSSGNHNFGLSAYAADVSATYEYTEAPKVFNLSISQGAGSVITVKRNGTALANGAAITYGDVLTITFAALTGYSLGTHTVNGASFTSGGTHTVTDNVAVVSTASIKTFTLSLSQGTGSVITVLRNGSALSHGASITYGDVLTISFGVAAGYKLGTHTVNGSAFTSGNKHTVTAAVSVVSTASLKTFLLSISAGVGSVIRVVRNGTALNNGTTITYGDKLTITFAASTGYKLTYTSHTSGNTYTVTADVSVSATAAVLSYLLSISQGEGTTVTVKRTSSPKQGAATGALSSGATVYHSDALEITITAKNGYKLSGATVNGSAFISGNSHTVAGAVNVAAVALLYAYLIGSGTSQKKYVAQIKHGGTVKTYVGYIKLGGQWHPLGR